MEAAITWVPVLGGAKVIERPVFHRRVGTVVRKGEDNAISRTTIRAVDVGIVVALVGWVEQFYQAICANRQIRRYAG
jgi:hypothetical protein